MELNEEQKKHLLDLFNAGKEVFNDFDIKYVSAYDLKQLENLLEDMKELFGIAPTTSENKDRDGEYYPNHWADHVWSDNPRAWKVKD